jgi:hypothetical protein
LEENGCRAAPTHLINRATTTDPVRASRFGIHCDASARPLVLTAPAHVIESNGTRLHSYVTSIAQHFPAKATTSATPKIQVEDQVFGHHEHKVDNRDHKYMSVRKAVRATYTMTMTLRMPVVVAETHFFVCESSILARSSNPVLGFRDWGRARTAAHRGYRPIFVITHGGDGCCYFRTSG